MRIVLTGGASGGHGYPVLALAETIHEERPEIELHAFFPERTFFPIDGWAVPVLHIHRLPGIGWNVRKPWEYPNVFFEWLKMMHATSALLGRLRPDVIVSFGTFLTVAASRWAKKHRVPMITHEQNVSLGRGNYWVRHNVDGLAVGMPQTLERLDGTLRSRARLCGQIVRKNIVKWAERTRTTKNDEREMIVVLILGGSQGSLNMNRLVFDALSVLLEKEQQRIFCIHVTGLRGYDEAQDFYRQSGIRHKICSYTEDIGALYARADLVVARAGAGTIGEVALFGLPLICIPYPSRHQMENATSLSRYGAVWVIREGLQARRELANALRRFLENRSLREEIAQELKELVPADGADKLWSWVKEIETGLLVYD